jgi:2,3-bisphosphoglycerate-dependent phosphoglycerate mutase
MSNSVLLKRRFMKKILFPAVISLILYASCTHTVYVVRHAEKIAPTDSLAKMMANDLPLSEAGKVRAIVLKEELSSDHIKYIYSTNTSRTINTANPLSKAISIPVSIYSNIDSLVSFIKSEKGNVLIVGHSNTVDDIVNKLTGEKKIAADLKDYEYDNLFIVKIRGKKKFFRQRKYGYPSNP